VMVALNRNAEAMPLALDRFGDFINARSRGHDAMTNAEITFDKPLLLVGKSATIVQIE
jgi:neopullulanase